LSVISSAEDTAQLVAVVTGASSGIGLHTALGLARSGMRVVMTGRDRARTEQARRWVIERSGSDRVDMALADFSRLAEVRRLADEILAGHARLDVLVNNAGLFSPQYRLSADGFELTFAVNHLAPFLLTNLLLDRLKASAPARIVTVASEAHRRNRINVGDLTRPRDWTMMRAYGRSKLCNILFTRALASRLDPNEMGAETPVFLATTPDAKFFHGGYVIRKALTQPDPPALDSDLARRLWEESARLVGL
jgi:retinol dehydrogenase 14